MLKIITLIIITLISKNSYANYEQERILLLKKLRCLVCESQSIYDSESDFARQIKSYIDELHQGGKNITDIEKILILEYGNNILLTPNKKGANLIFWYIPYFIIFIIAVYLFLYKYRGENAKSVN
jgi:cytochrome c-type biogenesis protein CcmH